MTLSSRARGFRSCVLTGALAVSLGLLATAEGQALDSRSAANLRDRGVPPAASAILPNSPSLTGAAAPQRVDRFNPPFPRIGVLYFYTVNIPEEIWKGKDLIVTRYWYPEIAQRVRAVYPDKLILAANNVIDGNVINPPDEWLIPTLDGSCIHGWHAGQHPGDCLYDGTDLAPLVGGARWNQYLPDWLSARTDWSLFDGTFWDSWASAIWSPNADKVDYNRNNIADNVEGPGLANQFWLQGNERIVQNLRLATLAGKVVVGHEAGVEETSYLNGTGFEFWRGYHWQWFFENALLEYATKTVEPRVNFLEGQGEPEDFARTRLGVATASLADAYFYMEQIGSLHQFDYHYDEFQADLGYPLGPPEQIRPGVWARYFDQGAVIANGSGAPQIVSAAELSGGPYYRFRGGQAPSFNNGEPFSSVELAGSGAPDHLDRQTGDGILLYRQPTTLVADILVDNVARNMTSPGSDPVRYEGPWAQQDMGQVPDTLGYALGYGWDEFGSPYAYTASDDPATTAIYTPTIGLPGRYEIFEWHPDLHADKNAAACRDVRATVRHADGSTQLTMNQSTNTARWNSLGIYRLDAGKLGAVQLAPGRDPSSCLTVSDAMKFVYIGNDESSFSDLPLTHWAYDDIEALFQKGFVSGCNESPRRYCPDATMVRAESAVFVVRGRWGGGFLPPQPGQSPFADVPLTEWYAKWVSQLWDDGFTAGCATASLLYCPQQGHTRAEATVFMLRMMLGADYQPPATDPRRPFSFDDVPIGPDPAWYVRWIYAADDHGLIRDCEEPIQRADARFRPDEALTRAEAACMMARAKNLR